MCSSDLAGASGSTLRAADGLSLSSLRALSLVDWTGGHGLPPMSGGRGPAGGGGAGASAGSWHAQYAGSAYVFVGGLDRSLTEGDVLAVMAQCGEVSDLNLPRCRETGRPRGFGFLAYADQRSTVLAVDNLHGARVAGRTIRVEHVLDYRRKADRKSVV